MTITEFTRLAKTHRLRGKILEAVRLVLVDGVSARQAAIRAGCTDGGVCRALARLRRPVCPACGEPHRSLTTSRKVR